MSDPAPRATSRWVSVALCFATAVLEGFDIQAIGVPLNACLGPIR